MIKNKIEYALKLAKDCSYADEITEGAKNVLRKEIDLALVELKRNIAAISLLHQILIMEDGEGNICFKGDSELAEEIRKIVKDAKI